MGLDRMPNLGVLSEIGPESKHTSLPDLHFYLIFTEIEL